jgi:hypothetical protein
MSLFTVSVNVGKIIAKHIFEFRVYPNNPDNLMLDRAFYATFGKVPTDIQYEVEVVTWFSPRFDGLIHIHKSKDGGKRMMCYPLLIPSLGVALEKMIVWAVGTAYTQESMTDFQTIFKGDTLAFLEEMEKTHHIKLSSLRPS